MALKSRSSQCVHAVLLSCVLHITNGTQLPKNVMRSVETHFHGEMTHLAKQAPGAPTPAPSVKVLAPSDPRLDSAQRDPAIVTITGTEVMPTGFGALSNDETVPRELPTCLSSCSSECTVQSLSTGDQTKKCDCYKKWEECLRKPVCDKSEEQYSKLNSFFDALSETEREGCSDAYDAVLAAARASVPSPAVQGGELLSIDFEDAAESIGSMISGFLENPAAFLEQDPVAGIKSPQGCTVTDTKKLGDGRCDGGDYNTEECNFDGGDCCEDDCRPAFFQCGSAAYNCKGAVTSVKFDASFECDEAKKDEFVGHYKKWRDDLTLGSSMNSASRCSAIEEEEHHHVAQAFNMGILLRAGSPTMKQAEAVRGGPKMGIACKLWTEQMGNEWFGTLVTHEMGHVAGYSHPVFSKMTFESECKPPGNSFCDSHCIEWIGACETHVSFGSSQCGAAGLGCKVSCVKSEYCNSLPERITECFGYQKVHHRGESKVGGAKDLAGDVIEGAGGAAKEGAEKTKETASKGWNWITGNYARRHGVIVPIALSLVPLLSHFAVAQMA